MLDEVVERDVAVVSEHREMNAGAPLASPL